ncbi:MAG: hypothetical protein ABW133_15210, partial [Polyangiaceae bacterium]
IIIAICTTDAPDVRSFDFNVPAPLADFIARALSRDRARRFQTAKEMLEALSATGITPVRTLGASGASQSVVSGGAVSGPGVGAASGPGENAGVHAPSGRTRVSWTAAGAKSADGEGELDARGVRAQGVRRRGLIALGGVVAAAAFLLTFGLLRSRGGSDANGDGATNAASGKTAAPGGSPFSSAGAAPSANSGLAADAAKATGSPSPGDSTNTAAPSDSATADHAPGKDLPGGARHGAAPPGAKPRRGATPPANPAGATPPPSPPAPTPAASSRAGVAGGLQIKTSYP